MQPQLLVFAAAKTAEAQQAAQQLLVWAEPSWQGVGSESLWLRLVKVYGEPGAVTGVPAAHFYGWIVALWQ